MAHFTPRYAPWDERLCYVPNGDLFTVLRRGQASVITDHIETFTPSGIRTQSGREIEADIIVTATGLTAQLAGGADVVVDGEPVALRDRMLHRGVLIEGVPNAANVVGYTNASWTLRVELSSRYLCRLLEHMESHGYARVTPVASLDDREAFSIFGDVLQSGWIKRGDAALPRQGRDAPWRMQYSYRRDIRLLLRDRIDDGELQFSGPADRASAAACCVRTA